MVYFKLPRVGVHLFGYSFSPRLVPTLITIFLLVLFLNLGIWQLHRAEEKRILEQEYTQKNSVLELSDIKKSQDKKLRYRHLTVTGFFDNDRMIYIDNKINNHKVGYHVLTPFIVPDKKHVLLVNRGFIAAKSRSELPQIPKVYGNRTLLGLIYFPSNSFLLKKEIPQNKWPLVLQSINLSLLSQSLQEPTYPFCLLLEKGDGLDLVRDWKPVTLPAYRHKGYAIQWFLLALTLIVIYLSLSTSRAK